MGARTGRGHGEHDGACRSPKSGDYRKPSRSQVLRNRSICHSAQAPFVLLKPLSFCSLWDVSCYGDGKDKIKKRPEDTIHYRSGSQSVVWEPSRETQSPFKKFTSSNYSHNCTSYSSFPTSLAHKYTGSWPCGIPKLHDR